jgi:hypothetical protein
LIADVSGDLSGDAAEKAVDDLFSDDVRFSGDDDDGDEGDEKLTCRSRGKGKGEVNGTRNKRAASKPPGRKKAASKTKKAKARSNFGFLERMRGRGGADMTPGIRVSGLGNLKAFAQRWLDSKKRANHPLVHGSPICDEVHEVLELPTAQPPQPGLTKTPGFVCVFN